MEQNPNNKLIKELKNKTGAGLLQCKRALEQSEGNFQLAIKLLYKQNIETAKLKKCRETKEGAIFNYIHPGNKIGVLLELNCETDFVARRIEFQDLGNFLATQIAASLEVRYISYSDIPLFVRLNEKIKLLKKKENLKLNYPDLENQLNENLMQYVLLNQKLFNNPDQTVEELLNINISLLGENIKIKRFVKFILNNIQ